MKTIAILGRQPALGIAELESQFGPDNIQKFGIHAALLNVESKNIDLQKLGGTVKLCQVLTELPPNWKDIEKYLLKTCPDHQQYVPDGKLTIGISVYGLKVRSEQINKTGLLVKKAVKATGRSVRIVPNKAPALNSAQVIHNGLTSPQGWELVIVSNGSSVFLGLTVAEQDIEAYSARDQARPARDAKVGMLPPKLAQIIINLATPNQTVKKPTFKIQEPKAKICLLDPFCGTGVLLQEAALMGYRIYGTDKDPRMVSYSKENLDWLKNTHSVNINVLLEEADATAYTWKNQIQAVACETFLGQPLTTLPNSEHLSKIIFETNYIHHRFLQNIAPQLSPGTRLCLAVPTWRGKHEFLHLPVLDHLTDMGYTRVSFRHVRNDELIYHRDNQVVGRELLVLEKI